MLADDDMPNTRTVDYAALERATGVRKDDTRSDIYFLGCIYYNMLVGQPPLAETRDRLHRLSKQRFLDVVPIHKAEPSIPACVVSVVNKAMMLTPENRYQTPAAMLVDLRSAERRLNGDREDGGDAAGARDARLRPGRASAGDANTGRSVMVVESDAKVQDLFREGFKMRRDIASW